ncbi:MAG: hypothetical protein EOM44_14040 [Bacteroidia bacterium]|nr:hypothetical protein [Bacteroidia bacterium]
METGFKSTAYIFNEKDVQKAIDKQRAIENVEGFLERSDYQLYIGIKSRLFIPIKLNKKSRRKVLNFILEILKNQ